MRLLTVTHPACSQHDTGDAHPERPARLDAVMAGLRRSTVDLIEIEAPRATDEELGLIHGTEYIKAIRRFCEGGGGSIDADTVAGPATWEAALRAAGAGPAAAAQLMAGNADAAFVAVRPPGHHAQADRAMGFCFFNNIAVTAAYLVAEGHRVAVVDWDVHHGNGTQELFYESPDVLYVSMHEFPAYPGTGWVDENGLGAGAGTTVNFPFPPGTAGDVYREATQELVVPLLREYAADWLLVSAGYDGHQADPLAGLQLQASDYSSIAAMLARHFSQRTMLFLEGGYDLSALESSVKATANGLAGNVAADEADRPASGAPAWRMLEVVAEAVSAAWDRG